MKNNDRALSTVPYICAFLIGVILFWSFGKNWLHLESMPVFLAGLMGVALVVLVFGTRNISRNSHDKKK
jgi:hypothetical protein